MGGSRLARAGSAHRWLAIRSSAQKLIRSSSLSDRGEMTRGQSPATGGRSARFVMRIAAREIVATIRPRRVPGSPDSGVLRAGITLGNSGGIPRAERAQDSSVVRSFVSFPEVEREGPIRRLVAFCPTSGPRRTGLVLGFRLRPGCRAGTRNTPRVISPSPVVQVFAAHAAIARERKHSHGKCREFPPNLAGEPRSRAASKPPLQATRPRPMYRLAGQPAGGLDDEA